MSFLLSDSLTIVSSSESKFSPTKVYQFLGDFSQIANMFGLKYALPYTWADLSAVLKQAYTRRRATLIEIKTNPSDGSSTYKRLIEQISHAVIGE